MPIMPLLRVAAVALAIVLPGMAAAEGVGALGTAGIIEMPNARMPRDAEISTSIIQLPESRRNVLAFTALPWAQASFRYAGIGDQGRYVQSSGYATWDRSFDLRLRLMREGRLTPDVVLGFQDIIGTGIYSGEYLVATKRLGADLEVSGGLGWGRLATGNQISNGGFRPGATGGSFGGELRLDSLFRGDVGAFGGLAWRSPVPGLTLLAEISSDDFSRESFYGVTPSERPLNLGLRYSLGRSFEVGLYQIGTQGLSVQLTTRLNPNDPLASALGTGAPRPLSAAALANPASRSDPANPSRGLVEDLKAQGVEVTRFSLRDETCQIEIENRRNLFAMQAIGRSLRAAAMQPDTRCQIFEVTLAVDGVRMAAFTTTRAQLVALDQGATDLQPLVEAGLTAPAPIDTAPPFRAERLRLGLRPYLRTSLFDPDKPLYVDVGLRGRADLRLGPSTRIKGSVAQSVVGNYDQMSRGPKGNLPHVRTDFVAYEQATLARPRLETLYLEHLARLSDDLFARASLGYLEQMYAGLSSEILWQPDRSPFALGAEVNVITARAYRQDFATRTLDGLARVNGHLSVYWQTPIDGFRAQLDIGRYLAADRGATLTVERAFDNGWSVGAFATRTSASAADFGEGAFDKGIFIELPLAAIQPRESREIRRQVIRSLSGDGGQRLAVEGRLHDRLWRDTPAALRSAWGKIAR